jgi:hypothetical protein
MRLSSESMQTVTYLLIGVAGGALNALTAHAFPRHTRKVLVGALVIAALAYVVFAVQGNTSTGWLLVELLGVGLYGTLALLGLRGSAWWLVAGWAAHPVWDAALHFFGPGNAFAPVWWTVPCVSWDLVVAGTTAYRLLRGWEPAVGPMLPLVQRGEP